MRVVDFAYHYKDTIITVSCGLGGDNFATGALKPNGGWKTVKTPKMPRVDHEDVAINDLHAWADEKGLRRADCGCCWNRDESGRCSVFGQLKQMGGIFIRHAECNEH
jgi:hypothetical protein